MKYFNYTSLLDAFKRDTNQFISLLGIKRRFLNPVDEQVVYKNGITVKASEGGVRLLFNNVEITKGIGLNIAINTLGMWTDSSRAHWQILERSSDCLKIKVEFKDLPLCQVWDLQIGEDKRIFWRIGAEIEESLCVNEIRVSCSLNSDYGGGNLSGGEDIRQQHMSVFPEVIFEVDSDKLSGFRPCDDKSGDGSNLSFLGFGRQWQGKGINYPAGNYEFFSGTISFPEHVNLSKMIANGPAKLSGERFISRKLRREFKVLLVNLPWQKNGKWGVRAGSRWPHLKDDSEESYLPFPFFLAYAAALLEENAILVSIIDAIADKISEESFLERVFNMRPDYLVVETSVPSFDHDMNLLKKLAENGISIILCGPCAEIYERDFLTENKCVDFVLYGEYEYSLLDLVLSIRDNKKLSGIKGLIYRKSGKAVKNPPRALIDINLLPWPHRKNLHMNRYIDNPGNIPYPSVQMLASRGCVFECNFCLWPQVMYQGTSYRTRGIKDVVDEMESLLRPGVFKSVYFDDDTFNIGKERMLEFSKEIRRRNLQVVPWAIMARADLMDEEMLIHMKDAGLFAVKYGVESASQKLIDACGKGMDLKKAEKMILFTKDLGIRTHLTFTFGLSGETKSTIERTIDYALKLNPYSVQFSITTPFPGTKYFRYLDSNGRIINKSWDCYDGNSRSVIKHDYLGSDDLELARQKAYSLWEKNKAIAA